MSRQLTQQDLPPNGSLEAIEGKVVAVEGVEVELAPRDDVRLR